MFGCSRQTQILLASNEDKPLDEIYADQLEKGTMVKADTIDELADESISLGDYVLTGGELAALVVIDSIVRLLPGALGDEMSSRDESFSTSAASSPPVST